MTTENQLLRDQIVAQALFLKEGASSVDEFRKFVESALTQPAQPAEGGETIGEAQPMPGTPAFTHCIWDARAVPPGTKLYTAPPASQEPKGGDTLFRQFMADADRAGITHLAITPASQEWRDTLTVNLLRHSQGLTKTQIRELIDAAVSGRMPDEILFTPASQEQAAPPGYSLIRNDVVEFLRGAGHLHGLHFGESMDGKAYWWRMHLPRASQEQAQQPSGPHLFEFWWETHMPQATQAEAWAAWQAAPYSKGLGITQHVRVCIKDQGGDTHTTQGEWMGDDIGYLVCVSREWQAQQPSGGEVVAWRVEVKPVAVLGLEDAHKITARIGNQSFHIGPDYLDSKQDAEVFAACFEHALKVGATPKPEPMTWQPIETAPRTSKAILVWTPQNLCTFAVSWDTYESAWVHFGGGITQKLNQAPTHWMPLPPAPITKGEA